MCYFSCWYTNDQRSEVELMQNNALKAKCRLNDIAAHWDNEAIELARVEQSSEEVS